MSWSCYLYFTPESEGTLFSKWSKTAIPDAMAYYTPDAKAKVPGYLTKSDGKRTEICRQISASRVQEFYRGYCEWIKSGLKFNSVLVNNKTHGGSNLTTILAFLSHSDKVYFPSNGEKVLLKDFMAVAVMNIDNNILKGIVSTTKGQFVNNVTQGGAYALRFDR